MAGFPEDPRRRRAVLVLEQHEIDKLHHSGDTEIFGDPHTHVITTLERPEPNELALSTIVDNGLDNAGTVLVQSPFNPDIYVDAEQAAEQFALTKQTLFLNFCQLLGATRVSVRQITSEDRDKTETLKVEGGRAEMSASVKGARNESERLAARLSLLDELEGGLPDLAGAEAFLREHRLGGDQVMRSLLQARSAQNAIRRRTVTLNLSTEAKNSLNVAGKLQIPTVYLSCDYKKVVAERKNYELQMEVEFYTSEPLLVERGVS